MSVTDLFSPDYGSARERFISAARRSGARLTQHIHPSVHAPDGQSLSVDCAVLGPDHASKVIVVQSGTHGVEGFCGSACQLNLLTEDGADRLPADTKLVLIHALNPYGFAWLRRVTEDNVDLNRNFLDHDGPYPDNPGYEQLKSAISPTALDPRSVEGANGQLSVYVKAHGALALQAAISQGQYTDPQGLYFGGHGPCWSNRLFRHIIAEFCAGAGEAVLIDIHTGLGRYGAVELISEFESDAPVTRRARDWWGEQVASTRSGESVSVPLAGTIDHAFIAAVAQTKAQAQAPALAQATPITLEFGTVSPADVFKAVRADNWLHLHGDPLGPDAPAIKAEIRRVFYPDEDDWKAQVIATFEDVMTRLYAAL